MEVILKSELAQPFAVSTEPDSFGHIFSNIYPFADAGSIGSQPSVIPDLIGSYDIAMNYHADPTKSGGINAGGNLELGNHGNGQVNTWGTFNVPVNWNTSLTANSRIYLIEFIYKYSSARQFLISGHFHVEFKTSTTMTVMIENQAAHGIRYYNKTHNFVDGQRVCIAIQMNKSDNSYFMVINGVDVTSDLYENGNPFTGNISNQTPLDWLLLGRWSSSGWEKYYGFDGDINLLAFGTDFNGSELSVSQMIELTNNPYQILDVDGLENNAEVYSFTAAINIKPTLSASLTKKNNYINELEQTTLLHYSFNKAITNIGFIKQYSIQQATKTKKISLSTELQQQYQCHALKSKNAQIHDELQQNYVMQSYFSDEVIEIHQFNAEISIEPLNNAHLIKNNGFKQEIKQKIELNSKAIKHAALQSKYNQHTKLVSNAIKYTGVNGLVIQTIATSAMFFNSAQPIYLYEFRINGEIAYQRFNGATAKQRFNGVIC